MTYDQTAHSQVVVGLFKNATDAQEAITDLKSQGFTSTQIGAAFRGGYGNGFTRASAVSGKAPLNSENTLSNVRNTGATTWDTSSGGAHENWWEKIKDAFRSEESVERHAEERQEAREAVGDSRVNPSAYEPYDYQYDLTRNDFEGSLAGTGIPAARAAYLTRSLERNGAIITVRDDNRAAQAEEILAAHNAQIRHEDVAGYAAGASIAATTPVDAAASTGLEETDTGYRERTFAATEPRTSRAARAEETIAASNARDLYEEVPEYPAGAPIDATAPIDRNVARDVTDVGYREQPFATTERADNSWAEEPLSETNIAADSTAVGEPLPRRDDAAGTAEPGVDRMQLFGEVLRAHKERIRRGEVRIRKEVVSEQQTIEVPVTREEFVLERVAVAPDTFASSARIGEPQEIRVPLDEDKVTLDKQPVVREEVRVGKREVTDVARVSGEVQHEEVRVDPDDLAGTSTTPNSDAEYRRRATVDELPDNLRRPA